MNNKLLLISAGLLASSQAMAWGDFLGNVLQNAAQQAATGAVNQAVAPGQVPQPVQPYAQPQAYGQPYPQQQYAQPQYAQPQQAQLPGVVYGANGCVQNVPAGPPGVYADADNNGCVTHIEYSNYVTYLSNSAPQYLGARAPAMPMPVQPAVAPASVESQAAGAAVQGLMGLFGR